MERSGLSPVALVLVIAGAAACTPKDATGTSDRPPPAPVVAEEEETSSEPGTEGEDDTTFALGPNAPTGPGRLHAEIRRIVTSARETTYAHRTHIDEATGRFDLDCSGLVDYALSRVAPDALTALRAATVKRPLAKHFVGFFRDLPPSATQWRRVERARDLVPGDIVAWLEPPGAVSKNTGHVMVVRDRVTAAGAEVAVPIYDSTSQRHGADDSRFPTRATGVGTGTIHLLVDGDGRPTGYRWSNGRKARDHATAVGLGRLSGGA